MAIRAPIPSPIAANMPCAAESSIFSLRAKAKACDSISSAMRSKASAGSIRPINAPRGASTVSCCFPLPKRCSTKRASSASVRAIVNASGRAPRAIPSTRRSPKAAVWPEWTIGCRCSRIGSKHCSIISAPIRCGSATEEPTAPPNRASRRSPIISAIAPKRCARIRAAIARSPPTRSIFRRPTGRRASPMGRSMRQAAFPNRKAKRSSTLALLDHAISRPNVRKAPMSTTPSSRMPRERRCAGASSFSPATRAARANDSPGCWPITA